ncbi:hypothetical protein PVK64_20455 [Aliivibrio sp. S4TY2]|uniref:hypothetical protein n=1 Tax=unclassified Aliivibrio TaxID=2645654 RepID=UPI002378D64C|nr:MULTISPECIES: hypothetical protein [unclassified Aliivibrio]MDD9158534.1 hypothetical protein [Aliivibrio sp. S4TY2]MDD9162534.1 hypothetical protein [Aliivibrio sp. S4TY1]MDD9166533.1 hypothetical protein [Aliivibrio sp. S4MY2]MDD9170531.1 hypothetical protein [Aliivibrio sp. S4MY4]MDD9187610.1 hypothetical protein [Aliivibrio sp. S4MY3]
MSDNESKSVAPITLTAEQIISLVGHGVTQEQLDSVRRELGEKMDSQDVKLDAKFDKLDAKIDTVNKDLSTKIDNVNKELSAKIDSKFNLVLGFLLANVAGIVALGFWLGQNVIK